MDEENASPTEFDVIVWGATGFTGKIVVEYLYQTYGNQTDQLTWAIAGRDADKLQAVIDEVGCDKIPYLFLQVLLCILPLTSLGILKCHKSHYVDIVSTSLLQFQSFAVLLIVKP